MKINEKIVVLIIVYISNIEGSKGGVPVHSIHIHYIYIYIYIYVCVCVCMCVCIYVSSYIYRMHHCYSIDQAVPVDRRYRGAG